MTILMLGSQFSKLGLVRHVKIRFLQSGGYGQFKFTEKFRRPSQADLANAGMGGDVMFKSPTVGAVLLSSQVISPK